MDQFKDKDFKKLQAEWYKEAGYEVETSERTINDSHGRYYYTEYGHEKFSANQRYYELAGQFLHDYKFKDEKHKKIWILHSEGVTIRQIAKTLEISKTVVHRTIKYLKEEMIKQNTKEDESE